MHLVFLFPTSVLDKMKQDQQDICEEVGKKTPKN